MLATTTMNPKHDERSIKNSLTPPIPLSLSSSLSISFSLSLSLSLSLSVAHTTRCWSPLLLCLVWGWSPLSLSILITSDHDPSKGSDCWEEGREREAVNVMFTVAAHKCSCRCSSRGSFPCHLVDLGRGGRGGEEQSGRLITGADLCVCELSPSSVPSLPSL